jgi:hypothetical protein
LDALKSQVQAQLDTTKTQLSEVEQSIYRAHSASIETLGDYEGKARKLLEIIGDHGIMAPFDKSAKADRRAAFWLRSLAGLLFVGMVVTVVFTAFELARSAHLISSVPGADIDWKLLMFRFLTAAIFAAPAYYFAREAARFQDNADRNRRMQLELASIAPFIDGLEASSRDGLRLELAKRYFGKDDAPRRDAGPLLSSDVRKFVITVVRAINRKEK